MVEGILIREAMEHRSHPPRETLHLPDTPQADLGIGVEQIVTSSVIKPLESPREYLNIGNREVQSLGPGRWNDMRRVSRQEEPAVLHGLDHEAAHARHAFLKNRPFGELPSLRSQTDLQFLPDIFVTPKINVLVRLALQV